MKSSILLICEGAGEKEMISSVYSK
uniref:Uncharacterized protein n=1 Tax=Rhizophora mucronata TaxID=61149 RepID=A0A2P2NU80_RHIMU